MYFLFLILSSLSLHAVALPELDVSKLTLSQKAGQLLILGFNETDLNADLQKQIKEITPGGLIFFNKNIRDYEQVHSFTNNIKSLFANNNLVGPWLAVDQEGSKVSRIKTTPLLPNAISVGSSQQPEMAYEFGQVTGQLLSSFGFNVNLAPVLDVASPYQKTFIGVRSFGIKKDLVASMGVEYSKGLLSYGVLPTAKHFPGTGNLIMDPHSSLTKIEDSFEQLANNALPPFSAYSQLFPSALMVSHVAFPMIDKTNMPSTYSTKITGDILRNYLKYTGIVITDDLLMDGATIGDSIKNRVVKALYAGADIVLLTWSYYLQKQAHQAIIDAVKEGDISEELVNIKVGRILKAKAELLKLSTQKSTFSPKIVAEMNQKISRFNNKLTSTIFKDTRAPSSLSRFNKVVVVSNSPQFVNSFRSKNPKFKYRVANFPFDNKRFQALYADKNSLVVIQNQSISNYDWISALHLEQKARTLVLNNQYPGIQDSSEFFNVVDIYNNNKNIGSLTAAYINKFIE